MKQLRVCLFWAGCCGALVSCGGNELRSSDWSNDEPSNQGDVEDRTLAASASSGSSSTRSTGSSGLASGTATTAGTTTSTAGAKLPPAPSSTQSVQSFETGLPTNGPSTACGNGKLDPLEKCDDGPSNSDTRADACRTSCQRATCGDGVRDDGESCDTGTQNSDTESDSCRTDCTLPRCGDGVVDVGRSEACDGAADCGSRCTLARCGDNVVEGREECEPDVDANCDQDCFFVAVASDEPPGDSDSSSDVSSSDPESESNDEPTEQPADDTQDEPQDISDESGEPNTSSDGNDAELLFDFESDAQGWALYETSPESLESTTQVAHASGSGENSDGALKLYGPFDDSDQKLETQVTFDPPRDMSGRVLRAKARLSSGLSLDRENPGGIKLFVKTGSNYSYAAGAFVALTEGFGWVEFTIDLDDPELVFEAEEYDPTEVRQIGIELRTFEQTTEALPATVYVDSISL